MSKPDRVRPGGWVAERWRYRAAQFTRATVKRREIGVWLWCGDCKKYHDIDESCVVAS